MNSDFAEMLSALSAAGVDFIIVGAHALAAHGSPRATGDLDIWVRPSLANAERTMQALAAFGAPLFDLSAEDLTHTDTVFQMGVPPSRIDILAGITGVSFDDAWRRRVFVTRVAPVRVIPAVARSRTPGSIARSTRFCRC